MKRILPILIVFLISPTAATAESAASAEEVTACVERNAPEPDSIRAVRFVHRDRVGSEQTTVLRLYGRRSQSGERELLVRFVEPAEMQGAALLVLERAGRAETYFRSGDVEGVKRISGLGKAAALFGTDLSYEDFERIHGLGDPGPWKRLGDDVIGDRPVYVIESRPAGSAESAYESAVSFVDKATCMLLRMELYEQDRRLRKILTVDPSQVLERGEIWVAHAAMMRDLRDYTTTQLLVDSSEQASLADDLFTVDGLGRDVAAPPLEP